MFTPDGSQFPICVFFLLTVEMQNQLSFDWRFFSEPEDGHPDGRGHAGVEVEKPDTVATVEAEDGLAKK